MKYNPALLKESVDKSLELLVQGKLKGPHISGEFELDQARNIICLQIDFLELMTSNTEACWAHQEKTA